MRSKDRKRGEKASPQDKSPGRWKLRSGSQPEVSPRSMRLKRRSKPEDESSFSPKKTRVALDEDDSRNGRPSRTMRDDTPDGSSSDSEISIKLPAERNTKRSSRGREESRSHKRNDSEKNHVLMNESRATRSTRSQSNKPDRDPKKGNVTISRLTTQPKIRVKLHKGRIDSRSSPSSRSNSAERTNENGHSDLVEDEEEDEVSEHEDSDIHSLSSDDDGTDHEDDDEVDGIDDDEDDSDLEVSMSSKDATILTLHKRLGVIQMNFNQAKLEFAEAIEKYEAKIKAKDEDILRLKNDSNWKDEQLEEMNELSNRNMELESKLNELLGDQKAYESEVQKIKKEKEREEREKEEKIEEEEKKNKEEKEKEKNEEQEDDKTKKKKGKRRARRGKKGEESEGEDIDALFVSDDDEVKITGQKMAIDITEEEESDSEVPAPGEGKKKKGAKQTPSKSDVSKTSKDDLNKDSQDDTSEGKKDEDANKTGRHEIRKVMTSKKLKEETVKAAKTEKERRDRAKKEHDKHEVVTSVDPKTKLPICTRLVLAFKEQSEKDKHKAKTPLVEVNSKLIRKLKPHQWEGVEFVWDNVIESMDKLEDEDDPGSGCILAHCMGLGKTLSMITLTHTLLCSEHTEQFTTCLIVCPLNTILNWRNEWDKWLDKRDRVPVFEMASCKHTAERAKLLQEWHSTGGVMIMGYQLFRILANYSGKSKKNKKAFDECLMDPGPDLVICDEGHVLKNDNSAISKAMNRVRTRRRVVLTGTPLQNNLVEYHCMMNFVKPSLLGTLREFKNRFVNPITNGQHADSTSMDVRVMKRRAHILHSMLEGCVQRKDYTELTKLLPPKHEYVLSVRLSELQVKLYEKYLEINRGGAGGTVTSGGAGLFSDYQALMQIWTHPWVLRLDEIRQEKKAFEYQDDELDELDEEESIIISDSEDDSQTSTKEDEEEEVEEEEEDESGEDENGDYRPSKKLAKRMKVTTTRSGRRGRKEDGDEQETGEESEASSRQSRRSKNKDKDSKDSTAAKGSKQKDEESSRKKKSKKKDDKYGGTTDESAVSSATEDITVPEGTRKAKVLAGEVIRQWKSSFRHGGNEVLTHEDVHRREQSWWASMVDEEQHKKCLQLSGKLLLLFEIVRMAETIGDKVLVFSQSLLSLDLIELFLSYKDEQAEIEAAKAKKGHKAKYWKKDEDYLRMDGSTGAQNRNKFTANFNDAKNKRLRLFLISTRAGGLGINLDSANRVIIFDASWNPSHDVQSIFRVYRFGQVKPVYVYRFLAQGTMEEKIYDRQVTKETLSQRVIDEHQIDRHFTFNDLQELYIFQPDRLNDPDAPKRPTPAVPKDVVLAELLTTHKDWIVKYHEHDSLLENRPDEHLSEEEREKAWEEYEREKQGLYTNTYNYPQYTPPPAAAAGQAAPSGPFMFNRATNSYVSTTTTNTQANKPLMMPRPTITPVSLDSSKIPDNIQLPRVVQEILKYNPTITTLELQKRLQAFLGMQSRYGTQQGNMGMDEQGGAGSKDPSSLPSRLPLPGHVPAMRKT